MVKRGITPDKARNIRLKKNLKETKLQIIRVRKKMSQDDLSNSSGVPVSTIRCYEQGSRDINGAKLETLCALSDSLGCKIPDILEDNDLVKKFDKLK